MQAFLKRASDDADNENSDAESTSDNVSIISKFSINSADVQDRWSCDDPVIRSSEPRANKPRAFDSKLNQHGIAGVNSGLALVDFTSIPGRPLWRDGSNRFIEPETIKAGYPADFEAAKTPHRRFYDEDSDPASDRYIDWAALMPPPINLVFFRRTGQSCFVSDWKNLEQHYITWTLERRGPGKEAHGGMCHESSRARLLQ